MFKILSNNIVTILILIVAFIVIGCSDNKATEPTPTFIEDNYINANIVNGGLLFDKWWKINGGAEPTTDFAPYPSTSAKSGADTWRCKECHGWDYVGDEGRYSSGSHYTGIKGLWDVRNADIEDIFDAIKGEGTNHDLSAVLSDYDIADLTKFVKTGLVDMSLYINEGVATGNANNGRDLYITNCSVCHGLNGNLLDFKSSDGIQGIGWLANDNPQETLHKIRWGHPGTAMPSAVEDGSLTDDETGDILAYGQTL